MGRHNYNEEENRVEAAAVKVVAYVVAGLAVAVIFDSFLPAVIIIIIGIYLAIKGVLKPEPTESSDGSTWDKISSNFDPYEITTKPHEESSTNAVSLIINNDDDEDEDGDEDEEEDICYVTRIAGVTFHNDESNIGGFLGYVRSDASNEHDPNAIGIYGSDNRLIGYIPKDEQEDYRMWSHKENLLCVGFINEGDEVDLYGKVKIVDADKNTTALELVKYAAWMISTFGVKFVPAGLKIKGASNLRTKEQWLTALYKYIDKCER